MRPDAHRSTAAICRRRPYTSNAAGRGPTWANSLFEDNAEFGFGMRTALDQQKVFAETLVTRLAAQIGVELVG